MSHRSPNVQRDPQRGPLKCRYCSGSGRSALWPPAGLRQWQPCPDCDGSGTATLATEGPEQIQGRSGSGQE